MTDQFPAPDDLVPQPIPEFAELNQISTYEEDIRAPVSKGFGIVGDQFLADNSILNIAKGTYRAFEDIGFEPEAGFDGVGYVQNTPFEQYSLYFSTAVSAEHAETIKRRIQADEGIRQRAYNSTGMMSALSMIGAVLLSPENYIPYLNGIKAGTLSGRVLRGGYKGGEAGLLSEAILHGTQYVRPEDQSLFNVTGGIVFGGALHGVLGKQAGREMAGAMGAARHSIDDVIGVEYGRVIDPDQKTVANDLSSAGSGEAQKSYREDLDGNAPVSALGLEKIPANPVARLLNSAELRSREIVQELADIPFYLKKNLDGEATPGSVRGDIDVSYTWPMVETLRNIDLEYLKYRKVNAKESAIGRSAQIGYHEASGRFGGGDFLTPSEFRKQVGIAMNRSDSHDIPEVAAAAGHARKVLNKLKDDAIANDAFPRAQELKKAIRNVEKRLENGRGDKEVLTREIDFLRRELDDARLRGPDVIGAKTYFPRIWRTDKILSNIPKFKNIIRNHILQSGSRESRAKADQLADEITEAILQDRGFTPIGREFVARAAGLRERAFDIPHEMVAEFLEHDVDAVLRHHVRQMGADIKLTERFGSVDMEDHIAEISDNWKARINATNDPELAKKFREQRHADIRDIEAMRDRVRGTYGLPANPHSLTSRSARLMKQYNSLLYMGGGVISALVDLARPMMTEGINRTMHDTFKMFTASADKSIYKMAKKEVQMAGTALDMVLGSRAMAMVDLDNVYGRSGSFEGGMGAMNNIMFTVNLMNPWTETMKSWSGIMIMNRILEATGNLAEADIKRLAAGGIDKRMAERIAKQFKSYGENVDGVRIANTEAWDDAAARDAFRNALRRDVDITIVTPGDGDRSLWMSSELGSLIGQFKSFSVATVNRVLIPGLQEKDAKFINGVLLTMGLGMIADSLKRSQWGDNKERSFNQRLIDGFDRSGLGGWFIDVNNAIENLSDNKIGLNPMFGDPKGRTSFAKKIGVAGPSASTAANLGRIMRGAATLDFDRSEAMAIRRALPFQNHIAFTYAFDAFEDGLKNASRNP